MPNTTEKMPVERGATAKTPAMFRGTDPFLDLRRQIDRVFGDFFGSMDPFGRMLPERLETMPMPKVDVAETDDAITITADLPGMDEKDIDLTLANGVLTLKGEKKSEKNEKETNYHLVERSYGSFTRSFQLPETVDEDKVAARFEKGVLTVTVPKTETAKAKVRHISIGGTA